MMEETFNQGGTSLGDAKVGANVSDEFVLVDGSGSADGVGFDILVEILVWIEFGAVAWKKIDSYSRGVFFEPARRGRRNVHRMRVDDEENLALMLTKKATEELQENRGCKPFLENHEEKFAAIGDGREHIAAKTLSGPGNHRRFPPRAERAPGSMVGTHPHFVSPVNDGSLLSSQTSDLRILPAQPSTNLFGILFECSTDGFLRCEPPTLQITSHRPNGEPNAIFSVSVFICL